MERGQAGEAGRVRSWPRRLLAALMKWYRMDWDEARARARVREARRPARRPCSGISLDRGRKDGGKGPTVITAVLRSPALDGQLLWTTQCQA